MKMLSVVMRTVIGVVTMVLVISDGGYCQMKKSAAISKPEIDTVTSDTTKMESQGPKQTECMNYNLKVGMSNIHYYSCCGGLKNSSFKVQPQYENFHCNPTRLRYATRNTTSHYNCNGEEGQKNAKERCSERWGWLEEPVDCWMWSECFAGACKQEVKELGSSTKTDVIFCGDGRCDANVENSSNCPIDCCQIENPECVAINNTCPKACCGDAFCCNGPISETQQLVQKFWMIVLGILAGLVVLLNVICCFCCYCCYSKCCKKQRRYSHIDVEMSKPRQQRK